MRNWLGLILAMGLVNLLPADGQTPPSEFTTNITVGSSTLTVNFRLHPIRSSNFGVRVQQADGSWTPYDPGPPSTYLGTVVGEPGVLACATLLTNGHLWARISFENGVEWVYFSGPSAKAYVRGSASFGLNYPSSSVVTATGGAGTNIYAAEIAVDSGWNHFNACGQDLYRTVMAVEHSILSGTYFYLRDAGILHRLGKIFIRANYDQDPYHALSSAGSKLDTCRVFLSANDSTHDVGTVADSIGGGVAWVGVIGTWLRYSACGYNGGENGDFSQVWRHEVGHNWSSGDFEGGQSEGATIMNGNALARMSGPEQNKIVNHRNTKLAILDNLGPYAFPLPPRASMDVATLYYPGTVAIDVLKNDHSGNGLPLSLLTTTTNSVRGGTVTLSVGTGPNGRDELVYAPPPTTPTGVDRFAYRITDSAGRTALGYVYVRVNPPLASPSPADWAGNVPPSTDLSWVTYKPGSQYDVYLGTDATAVATATTNSAVYLGRQSALTVDPGLLAAARTYYWRVDVVLTNGETATGNVWRFTTAETPLLAHLLVHLTFDNADLTGQNLETVLDTAYPANNFLNNGAVRDRPGRVGEAFAFDGTNSFVESSSPNIIPPDSGATLSVWMRTTNAATGRYLISVEGAWVLQYQGGGLVAFLDGSSSGNPTLASGLNDGQWHHVLAANDGSTTRVYVDGALVGSYAETIYNLDSLSRQTVVGANHEGTGNYFEGELDEVVIWARALSASEVLQIYTSGLAGRSFGPENLLTRVSFEAADGFTGYTSPNYAALGTKTDTFGAVWSGLSGDVQIWNRADIPPRGVQCLKLGDADAYCRVRFPGTDHGVGVVTFDYASYSASSACTFSLAYSNASSGGWVEVWTTQVSGNNPAWETKPWPTVVVPIHASGDVDLLFKKTGAKGVLVDNVRVTSRSNSPPVFATNPLAKPPAQAGSFYTASLAQDVYETDPAAGLAFSKASGPAWLSVTPDGVLTGTPTGADFGTNVFVVRVTNARGQSGETTLVLPVTVGPDSLMAGAQPNPAYARFWAWFAADNPDSPNGSGADADGSVVTRWDDVRGAMDHDLPRVSSGGGGIFRANRINGLPAIQYTGTRNNWGAYNSGGEFQTLTNGYTLLVVARVNALAATGYLFDGTSGNGRVGLRAVPGSPPKWQLHAVRTFNGPTLNAATATADVVLDAFQVHTVQVTGNTMTHFVDGSPAGSGTFNDGGSPLPMSGLILSCDVAVANHLECEVAEVLAYAEVLGASDRAAVENYLLTKYGLRTGLPPNPPVIAPPTLVGNELRVAMPPQVGYAYVLQATTNLLPPRVWVNLATNVGTGDALQFAVPIHPDAPQRFFRVVAN